MTSGGRIGQFIPVVTALMLAAWPLAAAHAQSDGHGATRAITIVGPPPPARAKPQAVQAAACVKIRNVTDLDNIRNDLAGSYCLVKDIDASSIANFTPIGNDSAPFAGTLDGRGRVIRGLTIDTSAFRAGLFGTVGSSGVVKNLGLVDASVTLTGAGFSGGLAGRSDGTISRCYVTGSVDGSGAGGLIGIAISGTIARSYSTASVRGGVGDPVGGLVARNGGAAITQSYATGPVSGGDSSNVGGLVGDDGGSATTSQSFATGPVSGGTGSVVGGLVGLADGAIKQCYAAGRVSGGTGSTVGGLVGSSGLAAAVTKSYWDTQTSGQPASAGGKARTTAQLQGGLPRGFSPAKWSITPEVSYPFLTGAGSSFAAPLATTVFGNRIYTFLPISQLDPAQYLAPPAHADEASLATVFTILARAIGVAKNVATLTDVAIDKSFWVDATQQTFFRGPVKNHATRGTLTAIPNAQPIGEANVIGPLRTRKVVAIRGSFQKAGGGTGTHWMLATSFIVDDEGEVTALVADDPWTWQQVRIDPTSKMVISPPDFPLTDFKVNRFQVITLN